MNSLKGGNNGKQIQVDTHKHKDTTMCELWNKRRQFFRLEIYTAGVVTDEEWEKLVIDKLNRLEQEFNESTKIRVHIHEE